MDTRTTLLSLLLLVSSVGGAGAQTATAPSPATATAPSTARLEVTYLANEGFLVAGAGRRVLVDALFGDGIDGYPVVPPAMRQALEDGTPPWDGVTVALASHFHGDHFDAAAVARFLRANPGATFLSTPQAVDRLAAAGAGDVLARARAVLPAPGSVERVTLGEVVVEVMNLHHGGGQPPVENLGFVVTLGAQRFLHLGDTEATHDEFQPHLEFLRGTDLALLPFWFLASAWRAEMVRDEIRPRWAVAAHLPEPSAPAPYFGRWQSHQNLLQTIRRALPQVVLPATPGEVLRFDPAPAAAAER